MLEIFNTLKPFFEDCYRRINVREYARIQKISPPTASKILEKLHKEGLLKKEKENLYNYYFANKDSEFFIELLRIYWKRILEDSGLLEELEKNLLNPIVYLFGSLSKAEVKGDSDIDLAIFTPKKKEINLEKFEKLLKRKIQINPIVYLFGSLSKAEVKGDSDIDLAIFTPKKKEINLEKFEKLLKRKIQIFVFKDMKDVKNEELLKNILNGFKIKGSW